MIRLIISHSHATDVMLTKVLTSQAFDPETMAIVELFHPRIDRWTEHFELINGVVHGLSAKGRATIKLLNMNAARRVQLRQEFIQD